MNSVTLHTAYFYKGDIIPCTVETSCQPGIGIHIIGLPDAAVKESLLRVITCLNCAGYCIPGKKIIINIEPHGGPGMWAGSFPPRECSQAFDFAMALGILIATEQIERPRFVRERVDEVMLFAGVSTNGYLFAPYTGIDDDSAAAVLSYQLRTNWDDIYGYPAANYHTRGGLGIYTGFETFQGFIEKISEGLI